jgi:hypothetical protein
MKGGGSYNTGVLKIDNKLVTPNLMLFLYMYMPDYLVKKIIFYKLVYSSKFISLCT